MKSWMVGGLVGACVGVVIYLLLSSEVGARPETRHAPPTPPRDARRHRPRRWC